MFSFHFSRKAAVIAAALVIGSASLFAEPITFEAGLFGTFDMNIGTQDVYVKENAWGADDFSNQMKFGYGGTVFFGAKNILVQNLGARVECGYLLNNGEKFSAQYDAYDYTAVYDIYYNSIEIPLLITYDIKAGPFVVTPLAGAYVSIPVGNAHRDYYWYGSYDGNNNIESDGAPSAVFGGIGGVEVSYSLGKAGAILFDARYLSDFTSVVMTASNGTAYTMFTRRQLQLNLGYKFIF